MRFLRAVPVITLVLMMIVAVYAKTFVWMEGTNIFSSACVEYSEEEDEAYKARNAALANAQVELLKFIWTLELREGITLRQWSDQNGYTTKIEGTLKGAEVVEETFAEGRVLVTIRKKLDLELIHNAIGKEYQPFLSKDFTGLVLVVEEPGVFCLMPRIIGLDGNELCIPGLPIVYFDSLREAFESSVVGFIPMVVKAQTDEEGNLRINHKQLEQVLGNQHLRNLLESGRIAILLRGRE